MKNSYFDLIDQTYYCPHEGFDLRDGYKTFHSTFINYFKVLNDCSHMLRYVFVSAQDEIGVSKIKLSQIPKYFRRLGADLINVTTVVRKRTRYLRDNECIDLLRDDAR